MHFLHCNKKTCSSVQIKEYICNCITFKHRAETRRQCILNREANQRKTAAKIILKITCF